MIPKKPLPLSDEWKDTESYVESLLSFATSSDLFKNLSGGVHILDFLTREPDLYSSIVPADWREFFSYHEIGDILDLLMREDINHLRKVSKETEEKEGDGNGSSTWRNGPKPPPSLVEYIHDIRRHSLGREFTPRPDLETNRPVGKKKIPFHVAVGMKPKKCHEVEHFSRYIADLTEDVDRIRDQDMSGDERISHIVDFGSGQNYLGRTLASPPYNKHVIAIEQRQHNINGAKGKDIHAKLAKKTIVLRNKKEARAQRLEASGDLEPGSLDGVKGNQNDAQVPEKMSKDETQKQLVTVIHVEDENGSTQTSQQQKDEKLTPKGSMDYVEHEIEDGYLEPIINHITDPTQKDDVVDEGEKENAINIESGEHDSLTSSDMSKPSQSRVMVVSLHSCGNLLHHGIRSLVMNPSVVTIAMIGCCYNLMTERLGPVTYKLRDLHPRLERTSNAFDPHGFPMSKRLEDYTYDNINGIRLNITARMMAVQAPYNWGHSDSESFFTRHFYRALLQRIFVDHNIVPSPGIPIATTSEKTTSDNCDPPKETPGTPLIVGSLRKSAFLSFPAYARAAIEKLVHNTQYGELIQERVAGLSDDQFNEYATRYQTARKNLSVAWSLMAFSASVSESIIVTDRWQFLREHETVKDAWVEPVFEYSQSPRNLVVVGIKK